MNVSGDHDLNGNVLGRDRCESVSRGKVTDWQTSGAGLTLMSNRPARAGLTVGSTSVYGLRPLPETTSWAAASLRADSCHDPAQPGQGDAYRHGEQRMLEQPLSRDHTADSRKIDAWPPAPRGLSARPGQRPIGIGHAAGAPRANLGRPEAMDRTYRQQRTDQGRAGVSMALSRRASVACTDWADVSVERSAAPLTPPAKVIGTEGGSHR